MSIVCFSFIMDEEKGFVDILMELEKEHIGPLLEAIPTMYGHPSIKNIKDFVCLFTNLVVKLKYIGTRDIVSIMTISHKLVFFKDLSEQFKYTIMIKATHPHCLKLYLKLNVLMSIFQYCNPKCPFLEFASSALSHIQNGSQLPRCHASETQQLSFSLLTIAHASRENTPGTIEEQLSQETRLTSDDSTEVSPRTLEASMLPQDQSLTSQRETDQQLSSHQQDKRRSTSDQDVRYLFFLLFLC